VVCRKTFEWGEGWRQKFTNRLLNFPELLTSDHHLPTSDDYLPTNDHHLPTSDDYLPTSDDRKASFYRKAMELSMFSTKVGGRVTPPHPLHRHDLDQVCDLFLVFMTDKWKMYPTLVRAKSLPTIETCSEQCTLHICSWDKEKAAWITKKDACESVL